MAQVVPERPESVGSTFRCQVDLEDPEGAIGGQALPHCQKQGLQEIQKVRVAEVWV